MPRAGDSLTLDRDAEGSAVLAAHIGVGQTARNRHRLDAASPDSKVASGFATADSSAWRRLLRVDERGPETFGSPIPLRPRTEKHCARTPAEGWPKVLAHSGQ